MVWEEHKDHLVIRVCQALKERRGTLEHQVLMAQKGIRANEAPA